ncbi:MAG: HAD-IA family hydrolase [Pseudomonadota bacterium]|nr:HAD-IA family hydrolase [Pseudomonadota bacterium]
MNRFDLLVFDWDGTIANSVPHIVESLKGACVDMGIEVPSDLDASYVIGLGLAEAIAQLVPELEVKDYPVFADCYRARYFAPEPQLLFEGARELLRECHERGLRLAVATGKSRRGLDAALKGSGLESFFDASRCADECHSKPHPEMLLQLMDALGVSSHRVLMIGDTSHDMSMALNADVSGLAVSFGAHPLDVLLEANPTAVVHSYPEMRSWLAKNA